MTLLSICLTVLRLGFEPQTTVQDEIVLLHSTTNHQSGILFLSRLWSTDFQCTQVGRYLDGYNNTFNSIHHRPMHSGCDSWCGSFGGWVITRGMFGREYTKSFLALPKKSQNKNPSTKIPTIQKSPYYKKSQTTKNSN